MTTDIDTLLERRAQRRRLSLWRAAAIILAGIAGLALLFGGETGGFGARDQIARVVFEGMITEDRDQLELLKKLGEAKEVKAVVLAVNSPGGTTTGGEALFGAIEELKAKKPVVAVCGTMATSAAYMISLATDRIVARGNTITGSVGVIFQLPEFSGLLDKLGVKMHEIKSGPLKASPSMFQPLDEGGRAVATEMVMESQAWFVGLVKQRRGIDVAAVPGLTDGRIYSGRQALGYNLIDAIGGEREAIAWLEAEKGVPGGLPVRDWKPKETDRFGWLMGSTGRLRDLLGLGEADLGTLLLGAETMQRLRLDGLLSVWQAPSD
jgi:protease-4